MAVDLSYLDAVELIRQSYGKGTLTWTETSQALSNAGITSENYLNFFENSGVFDVVKNADGTARNITWRTAENISDPLNQISAQINSNVGSSVVSESAYVEVPGDLTIESGATSGTFNAGLKVGSKVATGTRFVFGEVAPAVGAAMVGCALGKTIDGTIYDIGSAIGANPPWSLNPETWGSLVSDIDENDPLHVQWAGKALQFLLGSDSHTGITTSYMDENAVAAYAQWLNGEGFFESALPYIDVDTSIYNPSGLVTQRMIAFPPGTHIILSGSRYREFYSPNVNIFLFQRGTAEHASSMYIYICSRDSNITLYERDSSTGSYSTRPVLSQTDYFDNPFYCSMETLSPSYFNNTFDYFGLPYTLFTSVQNAYIVFGTLILNNTIHSGETLPGVGDQQNANLPDVSTWDDLEAIGNYLQSWFPSWDSDWNDKKITNTVPQKDGSQKTYTYVPVPFVNINSKQSTNPSTGEFTQLDPQINPDTDPATNPIVLTVPKIISQPVQPNPDVPSNPPDTGSGNTPTVIIPSDTLGTGLWAIYNPTDAELHSFGAWLWSSDFVDQIKKLFSNPMDAIIGLHQVYAPVEIGYQLTIKCGYLDSGVTSHKVNRRYSTVDCGTLILQEYFGNVFDYDPYTQVSLYLPFIGVVPLRTADVMRARLTVIYHVDVLTGACLAEVQVKRDGTGGVIYTFTGSCAVSLPFTSGSYMGAISSGIMAGINAIGLGASIASGNLLAGTMFAGGIAGNVLKEQTTVQKSGSFSGNAGAMGGKTPYLIITRPQTELADNYQHFVGIPSNENITLGNVSGYARVKSVHVESVANASEEEKREIESLLKSGVLIQ